MRRQRRFGWRSGAALLVSVVLGAAGAHAADCGTPEPRILSPSAGAVVRIPWLNIDVCLPAETIADSVRVHVGTRGVTDSLGYVSRTDHYRATLNMVDIEPGTHSFEVSYRTKGSDAPKRLSTEFIHDRPPCAVDLVVVDGEAHPESARVAVHTPRGPLLLASPDAAVVDPLKRDTQLHSVFVIGGHRRLFLDPGRYRFTAVRNVLHDLAVRNIELPAGCSDPTRVKFVLQKVIPSGNRLLADLHVHTGRSGDSSVPDRPRFESLVAAGLDLVVISDHNEITDPRQALARVAAERQETWGIAGVEAGLRSGKRDDGGRSTGHINVYPLVEGLPLPEKGPNLARQIDLYRARQKKQPAPTTGEDVIVQLNHPRGLIPRFQPGVTWSPVHAMFVRFGFDRKVPVGEGSNRWLTERQPGTGTTRLDFDVLEVVNRFAWGIYHEVRADWFLLMNLGYFHTAVGNSDSHALAVELAGFPVNLVRVPDARTDEGPDQRRFLEALKARRVSVSTGPVVNLEVRGSAEVARPGDTLRVVNGTVEVSVTVRAAAWVPVQEVRLVVNGETLHRETLPQPGPDDSGGHRASFTWKIDLERDAWIVAEAGWPIDDPIEPDAEELGIYAEVLPGYVPFGFTNAVLVDADGDGAWTPFSAEQAARRAAPMPETRVIQVNRSSPQVGAAVERPKGPTTTHDD